MLEDVKDFLLSLALLALALTFIAVLTFTPFIFCTLILTS